MEEIHEMLVSILENKIPKKTQLADFISETLNIEKETAYRRLRGDVPFSLREAVIISGKLNISLDEIVLKSTKAGNQNIILQLPVYSGNREHNDQQIEEAIDYLTRITDQPYSEFGNALSGLTYSLFLDYEYLFRFHIMKYLHHSGNPQTYTPFFEIHEREKGLELKKEISYLFQKFSYTYYIWNRNIISDIVSDIKYFHSLHLMTGEECNSIKEELYQFLDNLQTLASEGKFRKTANVFELYISDVVIDASYVYLYSQAYQIGMIKTFIYYATTSMEEHTVRSISNWIKSLKRCSILISGTADRERIAFFDRQKEIVDTL